MTAIAYGKLKARNPRHLGEYWAECEALYCGGRDLLGNPELMEKLFPPHRYEDIDVYKERRKRAYYLPYAGATIDWIVAGLSHDALAAEIEGQKNLPEYYTEFLADVSPPGADRMDLHGLGRETALSALKHGVAWSLVELPPAIEAQSRLDQEEAGALNAYVVPLDPSQVLDWEMDDYGRLIWAITVDTRHMRPGPGDDRDTIRETYTVYTATEYAVYVVEYKQGNAPQDSVMITGVEGAHGFGRVPLVRCELPPGLWAMNKLHSLARELLNKACALAWAEYKSLYATRAEFVDSEAWGAIDEAVKAVLGEKYGIGYTNIRSSKDRIEYPSPPTDAFAFAQSSIAAMRDEMHRVVHAMALSVDNQSSAARLSGESKSYDSAAKAVVLGELGRYVREHCREVLSVVAAGRGETFEFSVSGMAKFDTKSAGDAVDQALTVDQLNLPSPTFRQIFAFQTIKALVSDDATGDELEAIRKELETGLTQEQLMQPTDDFDEETDGEDISEDSP